MKFAQGKKDAQFDIKHYGWDYAACNYEANTDIDEPIWSDEYSDGYIAALDESAT